MLRIVCPNCGERDESEYRFGGEAHVTRPDITVSDAAWSDYLFNRDNHMGLQYERWCHSFGCGQWFNVARDTLSHEIVSVYAMGDPRPGAEP